MDSSGGFGWSCAQRADTWVGPYRGYKRILCFGGVANVRFAQRSRQASTLRRYQTISAHKKGASHGAPTCLYMFLLRIQICVPRVRARRPGAGRGYGVQRTPAVGECTGTIEARRAGTGAGFPDPLALAERAENKSNCCKALNGMISQLRGTRRCGGYTSSDRLRRPPSPGRSIVVFGTAVPIPRFAPRSECHSGKCDESECASYHKK